MKETNGEEIYGIEDVRYESDAWCEHCMNLESYDATVEMGTNWCLDCAKYDENFKLSDVEKKAIQIQELSYKFRYFSKRLESVVHSIGEAIENLDDETLKALDALLHSVEDTEE